MLITSVRVYADGFKTSLTFEVAARAVSPLAPNVADGSIT